MQFFPPAVKASIATVQCMVMKLSDLYLFNVHESIIIPFIKTIMVTNVKLGERPSAKAVKGEVEQNISKNAVRNKEVHD